MSTLAYLDVLLLLIHTAILRSLRHDLVRNGKHAHSEIIRSNLLFAVKLLFKRLPFFNHLPYAPANIVELKMCPCYGTRILLLIVVFCVNAFVIGKVNVVTVGVRVDCWLGSLRTFSDSSSILSH